MVVSNLRDNGLFNNENGANDNNTDCQEKP